jgi:predicted DNA-binding mobile mystery protein A
MSRLEKLARKQIERRLKKLRPVGDWQRPPLGWIRAMREALGMTAEQLAARLDVTQPRIFALEKAEARGAASVASLERAAEAMGCTLVYALVPNEPLEEMIRERARRVADDRLARVNQTMRLEGQGLEAEDLAEERERLIEELLNGSPKRLWD